MIFAMSSLLPTRVWDWTMRKVGFLNKKTLRLDGPRVAAGQLEASANN
jgi:hypothetical protein